MIIISCTLATCSEHGSWMSPGCTRTIVVDSRLLCACFSLRSGERPGGIVTRRLDHKRELDLCWFDLSRTRSNQAKMSHSVGQFPRHLLQSALCKVSLSCRNAACPAKWCTSYPIHPFLSWSCSVHQDYKVARLAWYSAFSLSLISVNRFFLSASRYSLPLSWIVL
jgi:hypothetical protein